MNEILSEYFRRKEAEAEAREHGQREKILIEEGLFEKEYSVNRTAEFCFSEQVDSSEIYYKKVPIEVTDEEFNRIIELRNASKKRITLPDIFTYSGIAEFGIGTIVSIVAAVKTHNFLLFPAGIFGAFAAGLLFIGFGEIIRLLSVNNEK